MQKEEIVKDTLLSELCYPLGLKLSNTNTKFRLYVTDSRFVLFFSKDTGIIKLLGKLFSKNIST